MCLYIWYSVAFANAECLFKTKEKKHFQNLMQASSHSFSHCVFFFSKRFLKFNSFQFICYNNNNNSFICIALKITPKNCALQFGKNYTLNINSPAPADRHTVKRTFLHSVILTHTLQPEVRD